MRKIPPVQRGVCARSRQCRGECAQDPASARGVCAGLETSISNPKPNPTGSQKESGGRAGWGVRRGGGGEGKYHDVY